MDNTKDTLGLLSEPSFSPKCTKHKVCWFSVGFLLILILNLAIIGIIFLFSHPLNEYQSNQLRSVKNSIGQNSPRRVIGYYNRFDKRELSLAQISKMTHIIYWDVEWYQDGKTQELSAEKQTMLNVLKIKAKLYDVKLMVSMEIGISDDRLYSKWNKKAKGYMMDEARRKLILSNFALFVLKNDLDGVHIDWKLPITEENKYLIPAVIFDMKEELNRIAKTTGRDSPYLLSMACHSTVIQPDYNEILKHIDFLNVHVDDDTYFSKPVDPSERVGTPPTLFWEESEYETVGTKMKSLIETTHQPNKLNMVLQFGGKRWTKNVYKSGHNFPELSFDQGEFISYRDMFQSELKKLSSEGSLDWKTKTMYLWRSKESQYFAFESAWSIEEKAQYAIKTNIGGIAIWYPTYDDDDETLMDALYRSRWMGDQSLKANGGTK